MKVFATALLAATTANMACAQNMNGAERLYCVARDGSAWIFATVIQTSVSTILQGSFRGEADDASTVNILTGACGSSLDDDINVDTNKGGIGRFR